MPTYVSFVHQVVGDELVLYLCVVRTLKARSSDRIVAGMYEDYLSVVLDEPAVIAVLTWGLSDRYSWLSSYKPRPDKAPVRPLPFDAQMQRKLAWNAIARAFDKAPKR